MYNVEKLTWGDILFAECRQRYECMQWSRAVKPSLTDFLIGWNLQRFFILFPSDKTAFKELEHTYWVDFVGSPEDPTLLLHVRIGVIMCFVPLVSQMAIYWPLIIDRLLQ